MFKINNTPVFEIVFQGKYANPGRRTYKARTLKSATGRLAWWMIFDKYGGQLRGPTSDGDDLGKEMPFQIFCECSDWSYGDSKPSDSDCPIHDRQSGYFARVKERLSRVLYFHADRHVGRHSIDNKGRLLAGEPELILTSD